MNPEEERERLAARVIADYHHDIDVWQGTIYTEVPEHQHKAIRVFAACGYTTEPKHAKLVDWHLLVPSNAGIIRDCLKRCSPCRQQLDQFLDGYFADKKGEK